MGPLFLSINISVAPWVYPRENSVFDPVQHPYTKMTQNERIYSYHKYKKGMAHEFWNYTDPGSPDLEKASKGYYSLLSNRIGGKVAWGTSAETYDFQSRSFLMPPMSSRANKSSQPKRKAVERLGPYWETCKNFIAHLQRVSALQRGRKQSTLAQAINGWFVIAHPLMKTLGTVLCLVISAK